MQPKILLVDDYASNRLIYRDWLSAIKGVEIFDAADGQHALELSRAHDFALFVIDINMPVIDGFALARRLRRDPRFDWTPIIFVTSEATDRPYLVMGYRLNGTDFLPSAVTFGEILLQKARTYLELQRRPALQPGGLEQLRREADELRERLAQESRRHDELRRRATHDALTHLPNRALFRDRLAAAGARAERQRQLMAIGYIDLDGFKAVNDRLGHAAGDALLASVAERVSRSLRATDTVARLGGDEFGLILEGVDSLQRAEWIAGKVHEALSKPFHLRTRDGKPPIEASVGASIGVALYPDHGPELDGLVFRADMAMYAAKRDGGGVRVFDGTVPVANDSDQVGHHLGMPATRSGVSRHH